MPNNLGNKETMARNIKYYMELNRVSAADMCRVLDVPQSTFSYWLHARTYPRIDKIEKMANYFGISKADLVEERTEQEQSDELRARILKLFDRTTQAQQDRDEALLEAFRELPPSVQEIVIAQTRGLAHNQKGEGTL